jgi:hypothetical protein
MKQNIIAIIMLAASSLLSPASAAERVISFTPAPVSVAPAANNCLTTQPDGYVYATSMRIATPASCIPAGVYSAGSLLARAVGNVGTYDMVAPAGTSFVLKSLQLTGTLKGYPIYIWITSNDGDSEITLDKNASGSYDLSSYKLTGVTEVQIMARTQVALYLSNIDIIE